MRESPCTIAILEDNQDRQHAMKAAVDEALPKAVCFFFNSALVMIDWLRDWLASPHVRPPALISLDHDLEFLPGSDGRPIDPGDGRDVAKYLAMEKPCCPIIIHTSNGVAATSMICTLQDASWEVTRIHPESDVGWVRSAWVGSAFRLVFEWNEVHGGPHGIRRV